VQTKDQLPINYFWSIIKKISYWVIPVVILVFIFAVIDINRLIQTLKMVNPWMMAIGLLIFPLIIFSGAYRWKVILTNYLNHEVSPWFVIRHYWIGLAIGKFFPASVTWDIYRIVVAGKKFGDYTLQTIGVLLEKVAALIAAILLILCLYPFIKNDILSDTFPVQIKILFSQLFTENSILTFLFITIIVLLPAFPAGYFVLKWFKKKEINWGRDLILALFSLKLTALLLFSSIGVYLGMAIANCFFFCSLNILLPFAVHLFLMPVFAILFLLPVTFAGFGLREGSFIIFYGFFGISMETALIVSFMNLIASLLNSAIGGIIMLSSNSKS